MGEQTARRIRHFDLFSGIGCWAIASKQIWPDREMVAFCEIDPFCQTILKKHYPDVPIHEDVRTLADSPSIGLRGGGEDEAGQQAGLPRQGTESETLYDIDLLTGSPPCQAASSAGKRQGPRDDRWLWPETVRVVGRLKPRYFILENVAGLLSLDGGLRFDEVLAGLEAQGYEVQPFIVPAASVGAPHKRDRVWICGRRIEARIGDGKDAVSLGGGGRGNGESDADTAGEGLEGEGNQGQAASEIGGPGGDEVESDAASTQSISRERCEQVGNRDGQPQAEAGDGNSPYWRPDGFPDWSADWREVAASTCVCPVDDGTAKRLFRLANGKLISKAVLRQESLKALGNAIVWQVAAKIMEAIKSSEY